MRALRVLPLALLALAGGRGTLLGAAPLPATPTTWVTDGAGFLSSGARADLEERLARHHARTGQQILLWIGSPQTDGAVEDWAARAFAAWGVGRKGRDDGAVVFILPDERKIRIEVGYGLEPVLPDLRAARIIRDEMAPRLQRGDRDGAARAGVEAVLSALGGGADAEAPAAQPEAPDLSWWQLVLLGIVALLALGFLVTHPRLALYLLTTIATSGGRGRSGGFGGGFRGGGGRSGGGGATGSW